MAEERKEELKEVVDRLIGRPLYEQEILNDVRLDHQEPLWEAQDNSVTMNNLQRMNEIINQLRGR
jgi:hypothetical protein